MSNLELSSGINKSFVEFSEISQNSSQISITKIRAIFFLISWCNSWYEFISMQPITDVGHSPYSKKSFDIITNKVNKYSFNINSSFSFIYTSYPWQELAL